jgi:Flp pilus assembly protein TadG
MEVMTSVTCRRPKKTATGERGQALLELLPVMLVLLTLTLAVIDFGRAIWQLQVVTGLTREGSNLASRNTTLIDSANAVINDGAALNLANRGKVIITSVQNVGGAFVITDQYPTGTLSATSKVGTYILNGPPQTAILPTTTTTIPQPGNTIYVTEIFSSYSPITPLGAFVNYTVPSTLYDVAYF